MKYALKLFLFWKKYIIVNFPQKILYDLYFISKNGIEKYTHEMYILLIPGVKV